PGHLSPTDDGGLKLLAIGLWLALTAVVLVGWRQFTHRTVPGARPAIAQFFESRGQQLMEMRPVWPPPGGLDGWAVAYSVTSRDPAGATHTYVWAFDPRYGLTGQRGLRRYANGVWFPVE